jgi:COP9 signalosome complex subunit 6
VFVNAEFELETFEPERIALEKVFKTAPKTTSGKESLENKNEEDSTRKVKKSKKEESKSQSETEKRPPSQLDGQLDSLQSSIRAMNARMRVLLEFLHKVEKGELPRDDALLRSVDGLLQKLPLVYAALEEGVASSLSANNGRTPLRELENDYNDTMLLSYLAAVAKTAKTVHVYTEKYRSACESSSHRS